VVRKATISQVRSLRRSATSGERELWRLLRDRRLEGLKFRRQFPVGPYVLDFVCLRHRLALEADGPFHHPEADARRDAWLAQQGFRVLRFSLAQIGARPHEVLDAILKAVEAPPSGEF
jgi:very-short-patch-repair endonuclease